MSKREKALEKLRRGGAARFEDLQRALEHSGFDLVRVSGSHFIYRRSGDGSMCNIQRASDGAAKRYQIDQVLEAIDGPR